MKSQKLVTSILSLSILASTAVPAFAAEPNEVTDPLPNQGYSSVTLEVKDNSGGGNTDNPNKPPVDPTDIIIATVPVELPIIMDLDGNVTVPTDAKIINHVTDKGIKVTEINATLESDWSAANYTDDFTAKADDTKELGLSFRNDAMDNTGTFCLTENNWNIAADGSLPLNMAAKLPKQTEAAKTKIATIGFTIDWSGTTDGNDPSTPSNPDTEKVTVTFTTDGNGILAGETTATINKGETAPFPTANPASIRYELSNWIDTTTSTEVEPTTPIMADTTIKAVFDERAASPKNWFTTDGGYTITGLSAEYLNLVDAPTDLVIPNNIGGSTIKAIASNAFSNKDLITSIVVPNTITEIGTDAFSGCTSITELNLDYAYMYSIANSPFGLSDEKIRWAPLEDWDTNPVSASELLLKQMEFNKSTKMIKAIDKSITGDVVIPTSVDGVNVLGIEDNGFYWNTNIISVTIPQGIKYIGNDAFALCQNITNISMPEGLLSIGDSAFSSCENLNSIIIPNSVTKIGNHAFQTCNSLTEITLPSSVETFGKMVFGGCNNLETAIFLDGAKVIPESIFNSCTKLKNVNLPSSITTIEKQAFYKCTGLTGIAIPDNVTTIGDNAFNLCSGLTSISIPDSVTTIGAVAFGRCTGMADINIPDSVTTIGNNAFIGIPHITYNGTATGSPWGALAIN